MEIGANERLPPVGVFSPRSQGIEEKKRVKGIEPSPKAWEAFVLPLNYTRNWNLRGRSALSIAWQPSGASKPLRKLHLSREFLRR